MPPEKPLFTDMENCFYWVAKEGEGMECRNLCRYLKNPTRSFWERMFRENFRKVA